MRVKKHPKTISRYSLSSHLFITWKQRTVSTKRSLGRVVVRASFKKGDHEFIGDNDVNAVDVDDDEDGGGGDDDDEMMN